mmetsp:Transcript_9689/g.24852  ORF Transcript_9689/g.24852 Transcript_9689/m.24852 type:complete len:252 (-) Transcript_9689:442-1197(-)
MAASRMSRKRHGHEPQRASRESARTQPTHRAGRARARRRASLSGRPENLRAAALRGARLARGGAQLGGALGAGRSDELTEERAAVVEQLRGGAVLAQVAGVHDGDGVVVDDGVEAVGDGEEGALGARGAEHRGGGGVGLRVDRGGGLVEEDEARAPQQRASEAEQLALADGEVGAALDKGRLQAAGQPADGVVHRDLPEGGEQLGVGVLGERVEVDAQAAREHDRVLGDDGGHGAEHGEWDLLHVDLADRY